MLPTAETARCLVWAGGTLQTRPLAQPVRSDSTLVDVIAGGVCGTDWHVIAGHVTQTGVPRALSLGHEILGRIARVGLNTPVLGTARLAVGDRVVVVPGVACGRCPLCVMYGSHEHLCPQRTVHGFGAWSADGDFPAGGLSSRIELADGIMVYPVPKSVPSRAAVLGELVSVGVRAVERALSGGRPDSGLGTLAGGAAAVLGMGPVGATVALLLRSFGFDVAAVEPDAWRARTLTRRLGIDVHTDPVAFVTEHSAEFDVVLECAGEPAAFAQALHLVRGGGRVLELGHFFSVGDVLVDPSLICRKDIEVVGSVLAPPSAYPRAFRFLGEVDMPWSELVTDVVGLDDIDELLALGKTRQHLKVVVTPDGKGPHDDC